MADPLSPEQRAAAKAAGGIGLSLVAAGASLVWGLLVAAIVLALVLLAVGAIALGCWLSTRRMRRAGVLGATAVTFRGAALGTGMQAVLSTLSSWLLGLLMLLTGVVGFWIVASIWVVASILVSALIGWLAGPRTWLAIARREARRAAAQPQQATGGAPAG